MLYADRSLHAGASHRRQLKLLSVENRVHYLTLNHVYKCVNNLQPDYFGVYRRTVMVHNHYTRHSVSSVVLPRSNKNGLKFNRARLWNTLSDSIKNSTSISAFKYHIKTESHKQSCYS